MSIRNDLDKVLSYARSHGIKVHFKIRSKQRDAAWILFESKTIVICHSRTCSLKELVASLLHELSHLITYCVDKNRFKAYLAVPEENPSKAERKLIYDREKADIANMPRLRELLGLTSVTREYIAYWVEYDTWQYRYYWLYDKYPNYKQRVEKKNKLVLKYGLKRHSAAIKS